MAIADKEERAQRTIKVKQFEARLGELRKAWDLYIQGIERLPPTKETESLAKDLDKLRRESAMWKLAEKFPIRSLQQKFTSLKQMWERNMKQLEDGTHRRTKAKVAQLEKARKAQAAADNAEATRGNGAQAKKRPAAAAASGGGGGDDEKMRKLYDVYMKAKKRTGDSSNISYEALRAKLQKQIPAIKKKHGAKNVEFKVVLKNGKAVLKAIPK
jgi:hypothetical protein